MNQVQPWVANRMQTLHRSSGQAVRDREWSDDRLGIVLDALSDEPEVAALRSSPGQIAQAT